MKKEEWLKIDWTKSNHEIAKKTGRAVNTVEKRRVALGLSYMGEKKPRKDKGISKPQPHLNKPEYQALATQRAKQSPKSGRFETNAKAKIWTVKSPDNKTYTFVNLLHFVRTHAHLFESADVVWRKKKNGAEWCRASSGIGGLAKQSNPPQSWKGWKLVSVTKPQTQP